MERKSYTQESPKALTDASVGNLPADGASRLLFRCGARIFSHFSSLGVFYVPILLESADLAMCVRTDKLELVCCGRYLLNSTLFMVTFTSHDCDLWK